MGEEGVDGIHQARPSITQPELERPDVHDQTTWARLPQIRDAWIRAVAPQLGLDAGRVVLGKVLSDVLSDDENVFALSYFNPSAVTAEARLNAREQLAERLAHEVETPEVPAELRELLATAQLQLLNMDWQNPQGFRQVRDSWRQMRDIFAAKVTATPTYLEAKHYADGNAQTILAPYWEEFLHGANPTA
jgi:hypothetical protein